MYFPPPPNSVASKRQTSRKSHGPPPAIKKQPLLTPRRAFTLAILICSFVIIILAVIFASCVALPHSDKNTLSNMSVAHQQRDTGDAYPSATEAPQSVEYAAAIEKDRSKQELYGQPINIITLGFYSVTLPFLTMLHSASELMILCIRPETLKSTPAGRKRMTRILPILSLCASIVLILGWIPMNIVWMNCEIKGAQMIAPEKVCPVQIRGHSMGGIAEVSITKVVFAWIVTLLHIAYAVYGVMYKIRAAKNPAPERRARFAFSEDEDLDADGRRDEELAKEVR